MHSTLKILMKRMESHPEEFIKRSRWVEVISLIIEHPQKTPWITAEDRAAVTKKYYSLHERRFTELVMNTLFDDDSCREDSGRQAAGGRVKK
jgi:hypothetical protein